MLINLPRQIMLTTLGAALNTQLAARLAHALTEQKTTTAVTPLAEADDGNLKKAFQIRPLEPLHKLNN